MVRKIRFQSLEPRVLLDAAGLVTADNTLDQNLDDLPKLPEVAPPAIADEWQLQQTDLTGLTVEATALVVVDTSIEGYETLLEDLDEGTEILLLDGEADGLQQIADYVEGRDDISSIHILSHGEDGELRLGTTVIDSNNIGEYESLLESIGQSLTEDGDILIYGCNVAGGSTGIDFVSQLALFTGADIAASTDLTGSEALGGDWELEHESGSIEAESIAAPDFEGVLMPADNDAPVLDSIIAKQDGAVLVLTYTDDHALDETTSILPGDFTLTLNDVVDGVTVTNVVVDGATNTITLTLSASVGELQCKIRGGVPARGRPCAN